MLIYLSFSLWAIFQFSLYVSSIIHSLFYLDLNFTLSFSSRSIVSFKSVAFHFNLTDQSFLLLIQIIHLSFQFIKAFSHLAQFKFFLVDILFKSN